MIDKFTPIIYLNFLYNQNLKDSKSSTIIFLFFIIINAFMNI